MNEMDHDCSCSPDQYARDIPVDGVWQCPRCGAWWKHDRLGWVTNLSNPDWCRPKSSDKLYRTMDRFVTWIGFP